MDEGPSDWPSRRTGVASMRVPRSPGLAGSHRSNIISDVGAIGPILVGRGEPLTPAVVVASTSLDGLTERSDSRNPTRPRRYG